MEITKVGVIGAGAIGAYFLWGMRELPREDICLIAKGERKERLIRNGIIINGERYDYPVKEPQEAGKVDLLLIATKYGALSSILKDAQAVVKEDTICIHCNGDKLCTTVLERVRCIQIGRVLHDHSVSRLDKSTAYRKNCF